MLPAEAIHENENPVKIGWKPLPGSQTLALTCPADEILFDGSRGPGKTDWQLLDFRKEVGKGYGRFWRGILFDREYKNLDDLVSKSHRWFPSLAGPKAEWKASNSSFKWVWATGEELLFRVIKRPEDYWNYHGQEFSWIGWNELTKYATPDLYEAMQSCNRTSFVPELHTARVPVDKNTWRYATPDGKPLPPLPLRRRSTTNPYGPGHAWVKKRLVDPAPAGKLITEVTNVFNPRTQEREDVTKTRCRIFGSYRENIYLTPEYVAELEGIRDENKRKAWLYGDWNIVAGGAISDVWDESVHVLPRFQIPRGWYVDASFDWGSTHPFSVGVWAEANGEEAVLPDGTKFCPPAGSLIRCGEMYGATEIGRNEGLKWSARQIAKEYHKYRTGLVKARWIPYEPAAGPADNQIRNVNDVEVGTIEDRMADEKVYWENSDKSPGSRINGLQLARDMLECALDGEGPGLFFMENCRASISLLPNLPRDPKKQDDVDTTYEDHIWDETRYRILKNGKKYAKHFKLKLPR